jgi:hypothetical protein
MATIEIMPIPSPDGGVTYQAVAGDHTSQGKTAGEALDALTMQLPESGGTTLVIVQRFQTDQFFDERQQQRLAELMDRWREARDSGGELPAQEQLELEDLIDEEVRASGRRTAALLHDSGR